MRRLITLTGLLLLFSNPSMADNLLIGIAVINQEVEQQLATGGTVTDDGSGIGIYADYYYKSQYRFNGTVSYVDYTDFYIATATAAADYLIPVNANFTLFAGATAGVASQSYSDSSASDMAMAPLYGVQVGGIVFVTNNLMMELGYRIRATDLETEFPAQTVTIEEMNESYLSLILSF